MKMLLSWCPGQSPCDPCPQPGAPLVISAPNLKQSYYRYPGLALWNQNDYINMILGFADDAGGYTATGRAPGGKTVTLTAKYTYPVVDPTAYNTQWFLKTIYTSVPDPLVIPPGTTWVVSGFYYWIGFQYANAQYVAVLNQDPVLQQ